MLLAAFSQYFFGISIFLSSLFLIMLVLVQRGRGGGLTGALGGPGGQSAFGTKAGDLFTRITIGVAAAWIFLCASAVFFLKARGLPTLNGGANTPAASTSGMGTSTAPSNTPGEEINPGALPPLNLGGDDSDAQAEITQMPEGLGGPASGDPGDEAAGEDAGTGDTAGSGDSANAPESDDGASGSGDDS